MNGQPAIRWGLLYTGDSLTMAGYLRLAELAERAGADSLWSSELSREAFVPLAAAAGAGRRLRLGTAVATYARTPMHVEAAAMAMAELTGGNFVLGLGTAPPAWNEAWHGLKVDRPVLRMREFIGAIRAMWTARPGQPASYAGELIEVRDYLRFMPAPYLSVPIYLAAVGPQMLRLAGEVADGLLANVLNTPAYFRDVVAPNLAAGRARSADPDRPFEVGTLKVCSVHADRAVALDRARATVAFYATLPYFDVVLDPAGFAAEKDQARAALAKGDLASAAAAVSDEMVTAVALAGTPDDVRGQLRAFEGLIDLVVLRCATVGLDDATIAQAHDDMIGAFAV
ncbi:MAG: LLM class flavin-dependent oxidoreductase [Alphaproteobacteria bacterium]